MRLDWTDTLKFKIHITSCEIVDGSGEICRLAAGTMWVTSYSYDVCVPWKGKKGMEDRDYSHHAFRVTLTLRAARGTVCRARALRSL